MADIFDESYGKEVEIEISDNRVVKGDDVNLKEKDPTLSKVIVALGWQSNQFDTEELDLDVSCFLLNKEDKTRVDEDFIFYNNTEALDGGIKHNMDSLTGAGDGDDETISIDLNAIPYEVKRLMFTLSIYKGEERGQTMGKVKNSYIRLLNADNKEEILRYELNEDVKGQDGAGMYVAAINREGPKWHFKAVGEFAKGGLAEIATGYDLIIHKS